MARREKNSVTNFETLVIEEDTILYEMHNEASKKAKTIISLRASEVVDFSSQYGSNDSISYVAENIIGPPTVYPNIGDNAYSYQLRTYGEWWLMLPSSRKVNVNLPYNTPVESQDFIEFRVEKGVVPLMLRVYEVYNPGAIVKLLCYCYEKEKWVTMWKGEPQILPPEEVNCFTVDIKGINFATDYYRMEFYHKHLDYFCEIDGIILYGESRFPQFLPILPGLIKKGKKRSEKTPEKENLVKSICETSLWTSSCFDILPEEVTHIILSYLDLQSLCTVARVSRLFRKLCYDPVLYQDVNLQLYWNLVDVNALKSLESRFISMRRLNLNWCGGRGGINSSYFTTFLETTCRYLISLKLGNCRFINDDCMEAIANYCPCLKELEMQSCRPKDLTENGFKRIAQMTNVTYLDLYRTTIDKSALLVIIKSLKLEHLLLGGCSNINGINEIAKAIGKYLKYTLKTLDLWRATDLTCVGIYELAENCSYLVELDLGWCYLVEPNCGCIRQLVARLPKLKKLFLTSIRNTSNEDLNAIAINCPEMEQLDILGTREYTVAGLKNLLQSCKKLKMLDISYCSAEVKSNVSVLRALFPNVEIKCSLPHTSAFDDWHLL